MAHKGVTFLWFSTVIFAISCAVLSWHLFHQQDEVFHCAGNLSMFQNNRSQPFMQGKFYLALESDGKGYIRIDGESQKEQETKTLHRFIFFNYHSIRSPLGHDFILDEYRITLAPVDTSGDEEFLKLVNIISQGAQKLRIRIREINPKTSLVGSVSSPLLICTSQ